MIVSLEKIEDFIKSLWAKIKSFPRITLSLAIIIIFLLSVYSENLAKAFAAIGTISAVIWALYHQEIKYFRDRPVLEIKGFKLEPPYFREAPESNGAQIVSKGFYINIPLENIGKRSAKNCQVMVTGVGIYYNDKWNKDENWLSIPLRWVLDEQAFFVKRPREERTLIPHRQYFFDFGRFTTQHPNYIELLPIITSTAQPGLFGPGKYCFEIKVTGEEIEPLIKYFYLEWVGIFTTNYAEMLNTVKGYLADISPWR